MCNLEPKCIGLILLTIMGISLVGALAFMLTPKTDLTQNDDTTVVIGDLVEAHGQTKSHMVTSLLIKGAVMVATTMIFFALKTLWDRQHAKRNAENFQNIDNHLREIKIATVK